MPAESSCAVQSPLVHINGSISQLKVGWTSLGLCALLALECILTGSGLNPDFNIRILIYHLVLVASQF